MAKKYLDDNGLLYLWGKIKEKFALKTHTHTKSEITDFPSTMRPASHTHGNITNTGTLQTTDVAIENGDKLVITDSSNSSKVARASLSFDASTESKVLSQKGTWVDLPSGVSPSDSNPLMDGTASAGTSGLLARGDHVHPTDTSRAPVSHASTATTYGVGNGTNYGHVKLSDTYGSSDGVSSGKAATPKAVESAYEQACDYADGVAGDTNVLEGVQMNGTDLTITSKKVNIPVFTGATSSAAGSVGLVPAPAIIPSGEYANQKFLSANGSFVDASSGFGSSDGYLTYYAFGQTYAQALPEVSTTAPSHNGLMSIADKSKLDSISVTNGIIDSSCLPSFVDDVIEAYARANQTELGSTWLATGSATGTVITPEAGKIYVLMNSSTNYEANTQFRWGGTAYVQLNDSGCTSITNAEIDTIVAS